VKGSSSSSTTMRPRSAQPKPARRPLSTARRARLTAPRESSIAHHEEPERVTCLDDNQIAAYLRGRPPRATGAWRSGPPGSAASAARALLVEQVRLRLSPAPADPPAPERLPDGSRYALCGEHARGGQARIWLALDEVLRREWPSRSCCPTSTSGPRRGRGPLPARGPHRRAAPAPRQRAGLRVRPDPRGAPVLRDAAHRGQTLAQALAERTSLRERLGLLGTSWPCATPSPTPTAAGSSTAISSPQNVMVGRFGETVLLDWGWPSCAARPSPGPTGKRAPALPQKGRPPRGPMPSPGPGPRWARPPT